jgi:zinc and cadmium transporter
MTTLLWISFACVIGGLLSVFLAAGLAAAAPRSWIPHLVSVAIGALLGAAFLEILPHAFSSAGQEPGGIGKLAATVLGGIFLFFILEKLVLWRHFHLEDLEGATPAAREAAALDQHGHAHDHGHSHHHHHHHGSDEGRSGLLIIIGDSFHNFVDGILVAAAFLESTQLGIVTAIAIIAHEIPQEIGDFVILLHSGYSRRRALMMNLLSSLAMLAGGLLAYFMLQWLQGWINSVLALAAASMIYVAVADLIPGLHKRTELRATIGQVALIALGVAVIWFSGAANGHVH